MDGPAGFEYSGFFFTGGPASSSLSDLVPTIIIIYDYIFLNCKL